MATLESNQGYSFTLRKIDLLEKALYAPQTKEDNKEFMFDISLEIGHNAESKECIYKMQVNTNSKKTEEKLGSIILLCVFFIPEYEEYVKTTKTKIPFPQDLLYLLNAVMIGTMRGVMYAEFRGTVLDNAYLPVLDPREFKEAT